MSLSLYLSSLSARFKKKPGEAGFLDRTAPEPERLCSHCAKINFNKLFKSEESPEPWDIMTDEGQRCQFCRFIARIATDSIELHHSRILLQPRRRLKSGPVSYHIEGNFEENGFLPEAQQSKVAGRNLGYARLVDSVSNMDLAKCWISLCLGQHQESCSKATGLPRPPFNVRVIDVECMCICVLPEDSKYLALSYVWGAVNQPKLSNDLKALWSEEHSLKSVPLPNTIRDAITLTGQLGQRYLWVDALCIINDDPKDRKVQIENMHLIYHYATITVIAAAGDDANAGLAGLSDARRRKYSQLTQRVRGLNLVCIDSGDHDALFRSEWNTRAWALQEKLFSRRALIFTRSKICFQCPKTSWREDLHHEPEPVANELWDRELLPPVSARAFQPHEYENIVGAYVRRNITDPGDILNAFAGLASWLEPFCGKMCYGMPINLLWKYLPWIMNNFPRRRVGFPSWSWAGWQWGGLSSGIGFFGRNVQRQQLLHIIVLSHLEHYSSLDGLRTPELEGLHFRSQERRHFEVDLAILQHTITATEREDVDKSQLIAFFTSSALLAIEDGNDPSIGTSYGRYCYHVKDPSTRKNIGSVWLDRNWALQRPSLQEFIVVAHCLEDEQKDRSVPKFQLMLVERCGVVTYRVATARRSLHVRVSEWWRLKPERKLILLG